MRGSKLEDVIFAGTEARKSVSFAEVSITIDNSDGKLPIDYTEVTVSRRAYRNGESEFFINKNSCRLKDIVELFMDTGIGRDGYSIIGQGRIDEILSSKSEERRHIFEEAAGIVKYRTRKEEAEKKLESTKQNLVRINDIVTEIENQLGPLEMQAEKAKIFLGLREKLKYLEIGLFINGIEKNKIKLDEINPNIPEAITLLSPCIISSFLIPSLTISSIICIYSKTYFLHNLLFSSFPHIWLRIIVIKFSYLNSTFICISVIALSLSTLFCILSVFMLILFFRSFTPSSTKNSNISSLLEK